jgi:putative DNA primase/helicase
MESPAVAAFRALLERAGRRPVVVGDGGKALCPSHDDHNASMSFKPGDRSAGVVAYCHACQAPLDQMLKDLGASEDECRTVKGLGDRASEHDTREFIYRDRDGVVQFRVVRSGSGAGKKFYQQRSDAAGGWLKTLGGLEPFPYRLPEVLAAIHRGDDLWFAEGEKNVEDLVALGIEATCNPGGAGKWRDTYTNLLVGLKRAVICVDYDDAGRKHADRVAACLNAFGVGDVTIVEFPGREKHDVSDWLAVIPTAERRERLLEYAKTNGHPPPSRNGSGPPKAQTPNPKGFHLTDTGNSERLIRLHGEDLRYVHVWSRWYAWEGTRWISDDTAGVMRMAKDTVMSIYREASGADDDERKAIARHATRSESLRAQTAMVTLAQSQLFSLPADFDADPWALNVENGTVDLTTGELRPHRRSDLASKMAPVRFIHGARHPVWDRFIERMIPDEDTRAFLQRAAGYTLTGDTVEEKLFFIHGPAASGKSTFISALQAVLGDYSTTCNFETFLHQDRGGTNTAADLARLPGVRMAVSQEVDEGRKLAVSLVKSITGRDEITARNLYEKFFTYKPAFKLWLVANDRPRADATDSGIWRRILLVPFEESLPKSEQDPTVKSTLMGDPLARSAILAWALAGLTAWRDGGLRPAEAVEKATSAYRAEQDSIGDFLDEKCVIDINAVVSNESLRKAYEEWCAKNGERPMSPKALATRLKHHGLVATRTKHARGWTGVRLFDGPEQTSVF